jgi:hypothetical protein
MTWPVDRGRQREDGAPHARPRPEASGRPQGPLWLRLLSLGLLGAAVGLAVIHFTGAMRHEAHLRIRLDPAWAASLRRAEMVVIDTAEPQRPASVVIFHFDADQPARPPLTHTLNLPKGRYALEFKLFREGAAEPVRARKPLEIDGEVRLGLSLP